MFYPGILLYNLMDELISSYKLKENIYTQINISKKQ